MSVNFQNWLIKWFTWTLALGGMVWLFVKQYIESPGVKITAKIGIPVLVAFYILWDKYYKSWQQSMERKLIAITTAGELGKVGSTGPVVANIIDVMGIIVPVATISVIFIIGGAFLQRTGILLLEVLALYMIPVIGKIIRDKNSRDAALKAEAQKDDQLAEKVANKMADKMSDKITVYTDPTVKK
jgi:hypothetical protein